MEAPPICAEATAMRKLSSPQAIELVGRGIRTLYEKEKSMKDATIMLFSEGFLCEIVPRPARSMIQNACSAKLRDKLKRRLQNPRVSKPCQATY